MIIGAQNLVLANNPGLEVLNGRELSLKVSTKFSLGASGLDVDLTQTWSYAANKLQITSDAAGANDPIRKSYFDSVVQGMAPKATSRLATAGALASYTHSNGVLTASGNGALSIDGTAVDNGDRVLVKNEAAGNSAYNGWFDVTDKGSAGTPWVLTRSADANSASDLKAGSFGYITSGSANSNKRYFVLTAPTTLGTDPIVFDILADIVSAGAGLTATGSTIDVVSADDSMTINANSIQVKLDAAGGITVNAGQGIKIGVDNSTIELNTNALRLKAGGITVSHLANNAVESAKLKMKRRFERITGNSANGTGLTLARNVITGREEAVQLTEDNAFIDYVGSSPDTSPSKEFTVSGTAVTLGFTQVTNAVYRVWYDSEDA